MACVSAARAQRGSATCARLGIVLPKLRIIFGAHTVLIIQGRLDNPMLVLRKQGLDSLSSLEGPFGHFKWVIWVRNAQIYDAWPADASPNPNECANAA